jgi:hypothetical protein
VTKFLLLLGALSAVGLPVPVGAQVASTRAAAILIFPRVVHDANADTLILVGNTSSALGFLRCAYEGTVKSPDAETGERPFYVEFDVITYGKQTTHWLVGRGREVDRSDPPCTSTRRECIDAGFFSGAIPAAPSDFAGELICVATDAAGFPVPSNHTIGTATLIPREADVQLERYGAIGLQGLETNNQDDVLCIGGSTDPSCPTGAEYAACPEEWMLNFPAESRTPSAHNGAASRTHLTVVPCSQSLGSGEKTTVSLLLSIRNEFEELFSASLVVTDRIDISLEEISALFTEEILATGRGQVRIRTPAGAGGVAIVARSARPADSDPSSGSMAALGLHPVGLSRWGARLILPAPEGQR